MRVGTNMDLEPLEELLDMVVEHLYHNQTQLAISDLVKAVRTLKRAMVVHQFEEEQKA